MLNSQNDTKFFIKNRTIFAIQNDIDRLVSYGVNGGEDEDEEEELEGEGDRGTTGSAGCEGDGIIVEEDDELDEDEDEIGGEAVLVVLGVMG